MFLQSAADADRALRMHKVHLAEQLQHQTSLQALATPVYSRFSLACRRRFESNICPFTFITSVSVGSRSQPGQPARTTFGFIYYYEYITVVL